MRKKNKIKRPSLEGIWRCGSCKEAVFSNEEKKRNSGARKGWDRFFETVLIDLTETKSQLRQAKRSRKFKSESNQIRERADNIKGRVLALKCHLDYIADEDEKEEVSRKYRRDFVLIQDMLADIEDYIEKPGFFMGWTKLNSAAIAAIGSLSSLTILAGALLSTAGIPNPLMLIGYQLKGQRAPLLEKTIDV